MSGFPDFTRVALDPGPGGSAPVREGWETPEGIVVAPAYGPDAVAELEAKRKTKAAAFYESKKKAAALRAKASASV